jgi:hypothetical protein
MLSDIQHTPNLSRMHLQYKGLVSGDKWSRVTRLEGFCHFKKTALNLPIKVIYFYFKVHTTVTYCSILVFATADIFLEIVELSKLYVGKRALNLLLNTCLV